MKKLLLLSTVLALAVTAQATLVQVINDSWTVNQTITDGNLSGLALSQSYSGLYNGTEGGDTGIGGVSVNLNLSGGYNGDLYGYLVLQSQDGQTVTSILLNRVGRSDASGYGYGTSGFGTITLVGTGVSGNIHDEAGNPAGGTYLADGRAIDPNGDFTGSTSTAGLDVLNGRNVNGTWTLFLADMSVGDQSTLVSWGLNVSVVPEPVTWGLIIFGLSLVGFVGLRWLRQKLAKSPTA